MPNRLYAQTKNTGKETSAFSTAPDRGMFQSRPFVVRSQAAQKSQPPDLKTSLMRAQRYGHRLHNIYPAGVSAPQAVQPKRTGASSNVEIIQMAKRKSTASGTGSPAAKRPRNSYSIGQHGYKKTEQKRLTNEYGFQVSGTTHQSEHPLGFEKVHNLKSPEPRGKGPRAQYLENIAPAYQERYALHRDHIGTNRPSDTLDGKGSGFTPNSYWDTQRKLLESGNASSAVQINQLGYAFNPAFRQGTNTPQANAATDSYQTMVKNMNSVTYAQGSQDKKVPVDQWQQQEMLLGRKAALTGQWPTSFEVNRAKMEAQAPTLLAGQQQRQQNFEDKRAIAAQFPALLSKNLTGQ